MLDCEQGFPDIGYVLKLLSENERVGLRYIYFDEIYFNNLINTLSDYHVGNLIWQKTIYVNPSIATSKILEKKHEFFECAKEFRRDANSLMRLICQTFDLNFDTLEGLYELKFNKSERQRGSLNSEWNYYFHGVECQFINNQTGQVVEVILSNCPEYGHLDDYFFYNYMKTTQKYWYLIDWINDDSSNTSKVLDILQQQKILTKVDTLYDTRNLIAL